MCAWGVLDFPFPSPLQSEGVLYHLLSCHPCYGAPCPFPAGFPAGQRGLPVAGVHFPRSSLGPFGWPVQDGGIAAPPPPPAATCPARPGRGQWFCSYFKMINVLLFFLSPYIFFFVLYLLLLFLCTSLLSFLADTRASEGSGRAGSYGSPEISPLSRSPLDAAANTLAVLVIRLQLLLLLLVSIYHQTVVYLLRSAYCFYFRE